VQSSSQIITTNKPTTSFFTGRMPFLSPNQQCQSTEGKNITFHGLVYPKLTRGFSNSVCDHSSLPWGGLPCLSSALCCQYPITPVPQVLYDNAKLNILVPCGPNQLLQKFFIILQQASFIKWNTHVIRPNKTQLLIGQLI